MTDDLRLKKDPVSDASHERTALRMLEAGLERGAACLRVHGPCMAPILQDGDRVIVRRVDGSLARGVVVLAKSDSGLICHRLLDIRRDRYLLAGDRSALLETHSADEIMGIAVALERGGRWIDLRGRLGRKIDALLGWLQRLRLEPRGAGRPRALRWAGVLDRIRIVLLHVRGVQLRLGRGRHELLEQARDPIPGVPELEAKTGHRGGDPNQESKALRR